MRGLVRIVLLNMATRKEKITKPEPNAIEILKAVDKCLYRISSAADRNYFRGLLIQLIQNNAIPIELLDFMPLPADMVGKTRFDQLFDAAQYLAFPGYRRETLKTAFKEEYSKETRIWRVILPEGFGIPSVLLRAVSMQEAYALACDYALRLSLRVFHIIPNDLNIRVMFVSERSLKRITKQRWQNRGNKDEFKMEGRVYSRTKLESTRIAALNKRSPEYSVMRYAESEDLKAIKESSGRERISLVESEPTLKRKKDSE